MEQLIVIGAGQAAVSLVARLRSEHYEGAITIIGEEDAPPYQRPPLSKAYLLGEMSRERLYLRPEAWYAQNDITLLTGTRVEAIDRDAAQLRLSGGDTLPYDQLVLATGSTPRRLPDAIGGALGGVYYMRDLCDADALAPELIEGRHMLVVGGGYIGLEAASVAAKRGLRVTVIEQADRILQRVAAKETCDCIRDLHREHGVEVIEQLGLESLLGQDRIRGARLVGGTELDVDVAIIGIGILPATTLAEAAGLEIDNGIKIDTQGRTSDPRIWAAGDCANFPQGTDRFRLESVGNAIDLGELVARNIMGAGEEYLAKPWFWSDQYDLKLQIAGLSAGYDNIHVRRNPDGSCSHWYYRQGKLIAIDALGDARAYMIGKRLIEAGKSPEPAQVIAPDTELKALLKA